MKLWPLILIATLVGGVIWFAYWVNERERMAYEELERMCMRSGFDGLVQDERGVYYCYRQVDGKYEEVLTKVVGYYDDSDR